MICIYHNRDFDGFCSAAIVKLKYPDAKFIGWDYGQELPYDLLDQNNIILVDISFPMDVMRRLSKQLAMRLVWIDHHISAIKDFEESRMNESWGYIDPILDTKIAACEATWKYCFSDRLMPDIVSHLGIYDTWRAKDNTGLWNNVILPTQMGLRLVCNNLETFPMELFESNIPLERIIENGAIILQYQKMQNESRCKNSAFERTFEGLKAICLIGVIGSQSFEYAWSTGKYDIMIAASYTKDKWTISLYTEKPEIDVSEICKRHGGGGHKGAAGFITNDINIILNAT